MSTTSTVAARTQMPHGTVKDGLAAFVLSALGSDRVSAGQPIPLIYGVTFLGRAGAAQDKIQIWPVVSPADPENLSWFSVKGPDGEDVRYRGRAVDYGTPPFPPDEIITIRISCIYGSFTDLERYYDLRTPGKYKVTWHYWARGPGAWNGKLISNQIEIEVE